MKPNITGATGTNPTTAKGTDGSIVLGGLTAGTQYNISYSQDGAPQSQQVTADANGNATLTGIVAGTYTGFVAQQVGVTDGSGTSDTFTSTVTISDPAAASTAGTTGTQGTGTTGTTGNATQGTGAAQPGDPAVSPRQGVLNDYFGNSAHEGKDARESVIKSAEDLITDVRGLAKNTGSLPASNNLLNLWIDETVSLIEDTTTTYLEKLKTQVTA